MNEDDIEYKLIEKSYETLFKLARHYGIIEDGEMLPLVDLIERIDEFLQMMKDR